VKKIFDEICVIGLGFVGLTTALSFANKNYKVLGVDSNEKLVSSLQKNKIPFFEPHLGEKLKKLQKNKKLFINSKLKLDKNKNYLIFICVGTPLKKNSFYDLDNLIKVVKLVEKQVSKKAYIFIKSTILPGTILGKCCVVGAGAVVKGNYPDNSIIAPPKSEIIN